MLKGQAGRILVLLKLYNNPNCLSLTFGAFYFWSLIYY